jgi:neutral trehalase
MEFWETKRNVTVQKKGQMYDMMFQYRAESQVPRPESFCEDVKTAMKLNFPKDAPQLWQDLASADESGWTFSCML